MVSLSTIICIAVTLFLTLILPIIIYVILGLKNKGRGLWTAWLLGAAGFFVSQILIRLPILNMVSSQEKAIQFATNNYVLYGLILAATAALVEVIGRYVVAKILNRRGITSLRAFAAGLGHGSIESIIIIGLAYVNNFTYAMMINQGTFDSLIDKVSQSGVNPASLMHIRDALINTSSSIFLLAGYERILTVILHIALSMIVCYGVKEGKAAKGVLIAFVVHLLADFITPMMNALSTPYLGSVLSPNIALVLVYVWLTFIGIASIVVIRKLFANERTIV